MSIIGSTPEHPTPGRGFLIPLPAGVAAVLAVVVYLNALHSPFVLDDFYLIVENPSILNMWNVQALLMRDVTRPMVNVSYAIDTLLWGRVPLGYHVTSVLLHAFNVVLVFWLAFLASEDRKRRPPHGIWAAASSTVIAFATAAVFAVHPMMTEAVGYISARSEVVYSAFFLLAFLAGRRWMLGGGRRWWVLCVGLWAAGLLSKETAAMLPAVLLAYDRLLLNADRIERRRRFLRLELPMLTTALLAGGVRIAVLKLVENPGMPGVDWRYALVGVEVFWRYLAMLFSPRGQSIFHSATLINSALSGRAIGIVLGLTGFVALVMVLRRRHRLVNFGLLWFALLLVPPAVLVALGRGEAMAERRVYLPAAGLFLTWGYAVAAMWARGGTQRRLVAVTAAVFLPCLASLTVIRNVIWQDPVVLSQEAVRLAPRWWFPRVLLGEAFRQNGQCAGAVVEYRMAIAMLPKEELPYTRLVRCLVLERHIGEAEETLRQLRAVNPTSQDASMGLGFFALLDGRLAESRAYFQETLARQPSRPRARLLLAFIDGTLPREEQQRVCEELRALAGGPLAVDACRADTRQSESDSARASDQ